MTSKKDAKAWLEEQEEKERRRDNRNTRSEKSPTDDIEERRKKREEERKKREMEDEQRREQRRLEREKRRKELLGLQDSKDSDPNDPSETPQESPLIRTYSQNPEDEEEKPKQEEKDNEEEKEKEEKKQKEKEEEEKKEKEKKEEEKKQKEEEKKEEEKKQKEKEKKEEEKKQKEKEKKEEEKKQKEKEEKQRQEKQKQQEEERKRQEKQKQQEEERKRREKQEQERRIREQEERNRNRPEHRGSLTPDQIREMSERHTQLQSEEERLQIEEQTRFNLYTSNVSQFVDSLANLCSDTGGHLPTPHLFIVGAQGCGKTSFVEALLGRRLQKFQESTSRLTRIQLIHNSKANAVSFQIQEEKSSKYVKIESNDFAQEMWRRNHEENQMRPINVRIEHDKFGFDIVLVDTPPLDDQHLPQIKRLVTSNSHFVCLVEAQKISTLPALKMQIQSNFDPLLTSTTFVITHLDSMLINQDLSREEINEFFCETLAFTQAPTFWVALLKSSMFDEQSTDDINKFNSSLSSLYHLIHQSHKTLNWDPRFKEFIGVSAVCKHLFSNSWKQYTEAVASISRKVLASRKEVKAKQETLQQSLDQLNPEQVRSQALEYVSKFSSLVEQMMEGGLVVASLFPKEGYTLQDEKEDFNYFKWTSPHDLDLNSSEIISKVPLHDQRLFGANQFKRFLNEFQQVMNACSIGSVEEHDIESAIGPRASQTKTDSHLAACSIARQRSQDAFQPLVSEAVHRAAHILKQLRQMAETYLSLSGRHPPHIISVVKDLFDEFVDKVSRHTLLRLNDEFYTTNTLNWFFKGEITGDNIPKLAAQMFDAIKIRILNTTLSTLMNEFVFSILDKTSEWQSIIVTIASYSQQELEEALDFKARREQLQKDQNSLQSSLSTFQNQLNSLDSFRKFPSLY